MKEKFEKMLNQESFGEADLNFVAKNISMAPKELLEKMGFISVEAKAEEEVEEVEEVPSTKRGRKEKKSKVN